MLRTKTRMVDQLCITVYEFEKSGDMLSVHTHNEDTNHITIISRGRVRCFGNSKIEGVVLGQGDVIDWPPHAAHGFVALTDNTRMVQINKRRIDT